MGYYSFCNCNANDNSSLGHHGLLMGAPDCVPGKRGEGFLFNQAPAGSNGCGKPGGEYIQLPAYDTLWAQGFTVCAWVRFDETSYYERIIDFGNGSGDSGGMPIWFGREGTSNNLTLESWISSNGSVNRSTGRLVAVNAITNGSIEYYCATIHQDTMRIYVNGVLKAEKKGHPILNVPRSKNFIGHSNWCANDPDFKGFMDEVRIYNRALSETEINNLYVQTPSFAPFQSPVQVGQSVQLQAQGGVAYQWWPTASLNQPNIANPVASPTVSTTYYCKITLEDGCFFTDSLRIEVQLGACTSACHGSLGENIYPNGDFGSGFPNVVPVDPGLAPGYIYQTNPPPNDGYYTIGNSTAPWGWFAADVWIDIEDNGPEPNGYMMVVNASYPPGIFFQNTVAVCENTLYEFSIDVINIFESQFPQSIRPNLSFLIDNVAYCETGDIPIDEQWHTVRFSFTTAPGQTSVQLGMRNNAPGGYGNDLAIDNISFRACGPDILTPDTLWFCPGNSVQLNAELQNVPFTSVAYQWQVWVNGNWVDLPGADSITWTLINAQQDAEYRLLVASALPNLALPSCRVVSKTIHLAQLPALVVQTSGLDAACFGQNNGTVSAQTLSGIAPYTYLWNTGNSGEMVTDLPAGAYQVTSTDAQGCMGVATVGISEPAPLVSGILPQAVSCFGGSNGMAIASASGGTTPYSFLWENGVTTDTLQGLSTGIYTLTITDAHGCTQSATGNIGAPSMLIPSAAIEPPSCFGGSNGTATAMATGGTGGLSFLWSGGQTTAQISGLPAGNYTVTIMDANGCTASTTSSIGEPSLLIPGATGTAASCFGGNDGTATAMATGGSGGFSFLWSGGQTMAQISGLSAGNYTVTVTDSNGCTASTSSIIGEPSLLIPGVSGTAASCFGGNDGMASASATGSVGPYTFLWSGGQTTAQISGLTAGNYTVTISDAHGCTATAQGIVSEPGLLQTSGMAGMVSCFGGNNASASVTATGGSGGYTYLWSGGQSTAQVSGLSAGNYTVTVSDAHGCTAVQSLSVDQSSLMVSTAAAGETSCFGGSDGTTSVQTSGGQAPYQYLWSNGQTLDALTGLPAGPYSVTATDALGCSSTANTSVNQPSPVTLSALPGASSCAGGSDGTLIAQPGGGIGPYTIWWSTEQTGPMLSGLPAGNYTLIATDAHGCTATASTVVSEPSALQGSLAVQDATCLGSADGTATVAMQGGTPPYSYAWQNGQTGATAQQLTAGSYQVTVTDAHGCTLSASGSVGQPTTLSGATQAQDADCYGSATGLAWATANGGTPPYSFVWQTGQSTGQVSGLASGWYGVSISDAHQCMQVLSVWVDQPPPLVVHPVGLPVSCPEVSDGSASALASGGVGPYSYAWSTGQAGPGIASLAMGAYTVTATDAHGCSVQATASIEEGLTPTVDLGLDQTVFLGEEILLTAHTNLPANQILEYEWTGDGGEQQCATCFQYQFLPLKSGCERVLVRSVKGCEAWDDMCYTLLPRRHIYVPNVFHPDDSGENDYFTIYSDASVKQIRYLKIYSRWGEHLFQADHIPTNHEPSGWDGTYRGQPMNPGVFVWVAEVEFIDGEVIFLKGDVTLVR